MHDPLLVIVLALFIDALAGDPPAVYARVPHPVVLIGKLVEIVEDVLAPFAASPRRALVSGVVLVLLVVGASALVAALLAAVVRTLPAAALIEAVLASTLLASRGLYEHGRAVARALERDLEAARRAVGHLVGRDSERLDSAGVARAAIESIAENFGDGVVGPVLAYCVGGLPGLAAYKSINTLDSMVGYRSARYEYLGKAAARLDDVANWVPARLAAALLAAAAALTPGANARDAWRTARRDAPSHRSLNAGWPEGAMAGALGLALAGPREYADGVVDDPWVGRGRSDSGAADVHRALALYAVATGLLGAALLVFALV